MTIQNVAQSPSVQREHALELLERMILIRRFEEKCAELYSATKIRGFLHLYIGEEAIASGAIPQLRPDDAIVATYREHGQALARGISPRALMAEMFGKVDGCSRGRGGSMHIFDAEKRFFGGNAIVGGGIPVAVGLALADQLAGRDSVTACFFGDGAVAEGEFHESMNLASLWKLPILFACENNLYAMGTALDRSQVETDIYLRALSYKVPAESIDGMDVLEVESAMRRGLDAVRSGDGPHFIEFRTYRFRAHSMYDPEFYREKAEVERWKDRDPIELFTNELTRDRVISQRDVDDVETKVAAMIDDAVDFADAAQLEPVEDLTRFVYSEVS